MWSPMNWVGALFCVVSFALLLHWVRLVERTRDVLAVSREATRVLQNTSLTDRAKEEATRRGAVQLFRLLFILIAGTLVCLLAPLAVIWILNSAGLMSLEGVLATLARWDFLLAGSLLGVATYVAAAKWRSRNS